MIERLAFDGYRAFAGNLYEPHLAHEIELAPLTLLIGRNNAGKTSAAALLQSVVLALANPLVASLPLQVGDRVLGSRFVDLIHGRVSFGQVRLAATFRGGGVLRAALGLPSPNSDDVWVRDLPEDAIATPPEADAPRHTICSLAGSDLAGLASLVAERSVWLDAIRQPIGGELTNRDRGIVTRLGPKGQGTLEILRDDPVLFDRVRDELFREAGVDLKWDIVLDRQRLLARRGSQWVPIDMVGDGIHQVLPVLTLSVLREQTSSDVPTLDTVLQPELHLHDALHPWLGDLLLRASSRGPGGLVVETHAEGLLLRIRRRIAEREVEPSRVAVYFVDDDRKGSMFRRIWIDRDGNVDWWPDGVFSEALEEVKAIRRAQRKFT